MSKEEIRRLLGGYATNTLTESERNALFEAALDDQELFNVLQQEQALKNLLDDPASRAEIRQALEQPTGRVHGAGRMRWWAFGGAASAVAAAAILFVVFHNNIQRPTELASAEKAPSPVAPAASEQKTAPVPAEPPQRNSKPTASPATVRSSQAPAAPAAAPPPIIPSPVQAEAVQSFRQQNAGTPIAGRMQDRIALANAPAAEAIGNLRAPLLRYALLKLDPGGKDFRAVSEADLKPGDLVRLQVSATLPGQLRLSHLDQTGEWQRVADLAVQANSGYTIPDSPIQVMDNSQKYRLTLETSGPQAQTLTGIAGGPERAMRAASAQSTTSAPAAASVVEITIGSKSGN